MTAGSFHDDPPEHPSDAVLEDPAIVPRDVALGKRESKVQSDPHGRREVADGDGIVHEQGKRTVSNYDRSYQANSAGARGSFEPRNADPKASTLDNHATSTTLTVLSSARTGSDQDRCNTVRERMNIAAKPILESFARRHGRYSDSVEAAIASTRPLVHPTVIRELSGALYSEAMRMTIALNANPTLVPLEVREGLAKLMALDLYDLPPNAAPASFPDRNKSLAPHSQCHQAWHDADAAAWLDRFPPRGRLPHPLDTWDDETAALWLNDRASIISAHPIDGREAVVVSIGKYNMWKPSLEVLHTLGEVELEELAYRVFVEQFRRDVMPFHVSQRRMCVHEAITQVTFGYRTLLEGRQLVRLHDLRRFERLQQIFRMNGEWIFDLHHRIIAAYPWPAGFSDEELWNEFPSISVDVESTATYAT